MNSALEFDTNGIHIVPRIPHLRVKLQNAFVNYNWHDWHLAGSAVDLVTETAVFKVLIPME